MSQTNKDMRSDAIRNKLLESAGNTPDGGTVAQATLAIWQQMASRLEPVIGARGIEALFSRSLHLASRTSPWLATAAVHGNSAASLDSLKVCLEGREPSVAADAGCGLLATFTELLASLIGESLTERLLGVVWLPPPQTQHETQP